MELVRWALITSILGIAALMVFSFYLEPKERSISDINERNIGEYVKITGEVISVKKGEIFQFDLGDEVSRIRVISFDKINVSKNDNLEVIGKVDEYYGLLEIKAERIRRIK